MNNTKNKKKYQYQRQKQKINNRETAIIVRSILDKYGFTYKEMRSKSRKIDLVLCREMITFKLRGFYFFNGKVYESKRGLNLKEVGAIQGGRDHTTIRNQLDNIKFSLSSKYAFAERDLTHKKKIVSLENEIINKLTEYDMSRQIPDKYINKIFRPKSYVEGLKSKESDFVIWERPTTGKKELHRKKDFTSEAINGWKQEGKMYDAFFQDKLEREDVEEFIISSLLNIDEDVEES